MLIVRPAHAQSSTSCSALQNDLKLVCRVVLILLRPLPYVHLGERPDGKSLELVLFRFLFETAYQIHGTVPECAHCGAIFPRTLGYSSRRRQRRPQTDSLGCSVQAGGFSVTNNVPIPRLPRRSFSSHSRYVCPPSKGQGPSLIR